MIGSLRGTVLERTASGEVLVEVGGVGYRASVPTGTLVKMQPGEPAFLFTHLHVREDAMVLFGFLTRDERDTFEALLVASGVGPKLALAILGVHSPNALRRALAQDDLDALVLVPGVGKRTAQRLLVDLKARLSMPDVDLGEQTGPLTGRAEVREALNGLGYSADEVRDVLANLEGDDDAPVEVMLRVALRQLRPSRA
ncbi:MAG TPA: Holliday junction branch migration protein RuvA [Acidimicrobiia bacterium]